MTNLLKIKEKINSILESEQSRFVLWWPVAIGVGIGFYFSLGFEPALWTGLAGMTVPLLGLPAAHKLRIPALFGGCILAAFFALGFSAAQWRTASVSAPILTRAIGPVNVEGRIVNLETRARGPRVTLDKPRISGVAPELTPDRIRISLSGKQPQLQAGQWIRLHARLSPPPPPAAPGAFDFQRRLFFMGIGGVGFSYGTARITSDVAAAGPVSLLQSSLEALSRLRNLIGQRVRDAFPEPGQKAVGAVTQALMTGDRGAIPKSAMTAFRDSGIAHLLAISGLHIGLVAGIVFVGIRGGLALCRPLALNYPIKKWAALAALLGAFFYAMIAGATVPTMRAFLMVGVVLVAVMLERRGLTLRLIAFAAAVILLSKPESLLGASFQLSFAAVTALVAVYEALSQRKHDAAGKGRKRDWASRLSLYVGGVALTTLIAGAATAPYAAYHFNRFADYGLAANLLAVPMTALWVMPWAVVAFALMPFGLEDLALVPMGAGVSLVIGVAAEVASWPGAVTLLPAMQVWALAAITFGGLWLCLWRTGWRWFGLAGVVAGLASLLWVETPDILIDGRGRLTGLKNDHGQIQVSSMRTARFTRDIWLRRAAQAKPLPWPAGETGASGPLACDDLGCIYRIRGWTVALVDKPAAIEEDCRRADLLIARVPVRIRCPGPEHVIDRFDMWRNGGYALWFSDDGNVRIETVNGVRGDRPWVLRPTRRPRTGDGL